MPAHLNQKGMCVVVWSGTSAPFTAPDGTVSTVDYPGEFAVMAPNQLANYMPGTEAVFEWDTKENVIVKFVEKNN